MRYVEENGEIDEVIRNMVLVVIVVVEEVWMRFIVYIEDLEIGEEIDFIECVFVFVRIGIIFEYIIDYF